MSVAWPERSGDPSKDFALLRARIPYAAYLDIQVNASDGALRFRLPFRETLIGDSALPAIHGGVIAGFMECSAQMQLLLTMPERRLPKNIDFSIDYLRSGNPADCFVDCEVMRQGRRVAQVQIRCWQYERAAHREATQRTRDIALARAHFLLATEVDAAASG
ncbi:MAG TPA: PaaI family thioesterase [Nevskiaceae bacterium]|nr:PaaI family thioesterase [Nevskiaceae bacterium]